MQIQDVSVISLIVVQIFLLALTTYLVITNKRFSKDFNTAKTASLIQTNKVVQTLNEIFTVRTTIENHFLDLALGRGVDPQIRDDVLIYLQFCVHRLKDIMDEITNDQCAVSVKLLTQGDSDPEKGSEPFVETFLRDEKSEILRRTVDQELESYSFSEHSPFHEIVVSDPVIGHFASDNLRELESQGLYSNINPNWKLLYNATVIVPIKDPLYNSNTEIAGFLCVDNWRGGMQKEAIAGILKVVASSIFYALRTLALFEERDAQDADLDEVTE